MTKSASEDEAEGEDDPEEEVGLTLERLATIMRSAKDLQKMVDEWDLEMIRALQFRNAIDGALLVYKNIFTQKSSSASNCLSLCSWLDNQGKSVAIEVPEGEEEVMKSPDEAFDIEPLEEL